MARKQGDVFLITSDVVAGDAPRNRPPNQSVNLPLMYWNGSSWSTEIASAKTFSSLELADEYTRANYVRLSAKT